MSSPVSDARSESGAAAVSEGQQSFAETALRLGGKSDDEARRTGAVDTADDQVESLFSEQYKTASSPAHRAVWDRSVPMELFKFETPSVPDRTKRVMQDSLGVVRRHKQEGTIYDEHGKIAEAVLKDLADAGYWGTLVSEQYGGSGFRFEHFATFLTQMATVESTVSGLASVHGCIGAVDPVRTFGNTEQRERFLPELASGRRLSAFALTEPGAGSDLTALKTTAVLDGDDYVVNGEKIFITNAKPGRTIGLVCRIDDKPAVLIADLPHEENEHFALKTYGLYALRRTHNNGMIFRGFRVPAANLLQPVRGDGLTVAYHGLNLGRVALCAGAAGNMRRMLTDMIPWAHYRRTYGQPISGRELVQRRIAEMAGYIVGCDALVRWCSSLIEQGYRGEMECIVAKIFGSEALKTAAIELHMKTHGGRSFLHGHEFGDNVHEFLAPCIYEGEGEMLGMAFFKSVVKKHGRAFFEPMGRILYENGIRKPNLMNPLHVWKLREPLMAYARWFAGRRLAGFGRAPLPAMPNHLRQHAEFARQFLSSSCFEVTGMMRKFQLALADRQCAMARTSQRIQDGIVMLCTSLHATSEADELTTGAADVLCTRLRRRLRGSRPSSRDDCRATEVGAAIADGKWSALEGIAGVDILMQYARPDD